MITPAVIDPAEIWPRLWEGFSGHVGWDVGANCGQTLGVMTERFSKVWAFEPAFESFEMLRMTIEELFADQAFAFSLALGSSCGWLDLVAVPDKIATGQLVSPHASGMEFDAKSFGSVTRSVECLTIDHIIERAPDFKPDFLKIDVEGHELEVLLGAKRLLKSRPEMLIEIHSHALGEAIREMLLPLGYALDFVRHPHYFPGTAMWNTHFWIRCLPA